MRIIASILFICLSFFTAVTASAEEQVTKFSTEYLFDEKKDFNSRELIVKFNPSVTDSQKTSVLQGLKVKEISTLDKGDFSLLYVSREEDLLPLAEELLSKGEVDFAEPNYNFSSNFAPKDPGVEFQWHLSKVELPQAWDVTRGSAEITVAIVDGGVQTDHPDLKGKIIHPFDIVTGSPVIYGDFHGTHVAGIIAASHNNIGVAGIAPNIKIMPVNVFKGDSASVYDVVRGIYYAADHQANIINLSLGSRSYSQALANAVDYARSKGVVVIAAAGNENTYLRTFPAAFQGVIGVSATNSNDEITRFSNYGDYIDLAAPGEGIYSTINGSSYQYSDGTSMAAPIVSGVSALILSKNPFLSPDDVEMILTRSAIDLGLEGRDYYYGAGRIDAYRALQQTPGPMSPIKVPASIFRIDGFNKMNVSTEIYKGTRVSVEIKNSKNDVVKRLVSNKEWNGGKLSLSWNGKQDDGQFAHSGSYKIHIKVANGLETMSKSAEIEVKNVVNPVIKLDRKSEVFSPSISKKLVVPYSLNKDAKVTAAIYNSRNKKVKSLTTSKPIKNGNRSISWTGKDKKSKTVPDGKYTLVIYAVDSQNRKSTVKRLDIKVDTSKPKATAALSNSLYKMDGKTKAKLKLKVKETVYIDAYITTKKGTKVKKIASNRKYNSGSHSLVWDGKNAKTRYAAEGKYLFRVEVRDQAGNKRVVKSPIFSLQDWRKPVIEGKSLTEYRNTGITTFTYKLNKPGYVKVEVFKDQTQIRTIQPKTWKKSGSQQFKWDAKSKSHRQLKDGKYQYRITITDAYKQKAEFSSALNIALTRADIVHPSSIPKK
ncbi:S8 family serine peptidase [Mesobacillus thioparans]|uniref:S8 family serine peptidase n=1 Tax=Mesobacillus thioparans TaxID=370439 RepID=UPI0039F06DB4